MMLYTFGLTLLANAVLVVQGQRIQQGCFDAVSISCSNPYDPYSNVDAEEVCTRLMLEVFPTQGVMTDPSQHAEYLNGIEADSEFCPQIQQAYSECLFCADDVDLFIEDCWIHTPWTQCGDVPSLEEALADNEDPILARYTTVEDIDEACVKIDEAQTVSILKDWDVGIPSTQHLCLAQTKIKHICPGYCEGGCFDGPTGTPPSCEPYPGPFDEEVVDWRVCDTLDYDYLFFISWNGEFEDIYNTSRHADYLRGIPGNTTECAAAQQSYSQCFWCATDLCFTPENPPSCEKPDDELLAQIDDKFFVDPWPNRICGALYSSLWLLDDTTPDFYNISLHGDMFRFGSETSFCTLAKAFYHQCRWCHQTEYQESFCNFGTWCDSNATIPEDYVLPERFQNFNLSNPASEGYNCSRNFDEFEYDYGHFTLDRCYADIWLHRQCPEEYCGIAPPEELDFDYLGATNDKQKKALVWVSRAAAFLSFLGAAYILQDIARTKKKRENVYYQLLIPIAIFDVVTAAAWCFATAPIDKDGPGHYVYGALGTEATCTAQAFFIQLGFTSIFYNVSLSIYYVLTIARGWKEFQLKKIRWWLHGLPLLYGIGLACGAISNYHWIEYGCHLLPPPDGEMWPIIVFVVGPLGLSIISITASMWIVYRKVQVQVAKAKKWRLGGGGSAGSSMEREVFWQCLCYVLAFYITWPIMFAVCLASVDVNGPLALTMTVAFVAPLQGFSNSMVYIRPKVKTLLGSMSFRTGSVFSKFSMKKSSKDSESGVTSASFGRPSTIASGTDRTSSRPASAAESALEELEQEDMDPSALLPRKNEIMEQMPDTPDIPESPEAPLDGYPPKTSAVTFQQDVEADNMHAVEDPDVSESAQSRGRTSPTPALAAAAQKRGIPLELLQQSEDFNVHSDEE